MGKNTDLKVKKIFDEDELKNIKKQAQKIAKKKTKKPAKPKNKIVTEESESNKNTLMLIIAFIALIGIGIFIKFYAAKNTVVEEKKSILPLFGETVDPDDKMIKPHEITLKEIFNYHWTDNPIALTQMFEVISIVRAPVKQARIRINLPEYKGKRIPMRSPGDFLTPEYKIVDIQQPVIFLTDKKGKLHRLVERSSWNIASEIFDWPPDVFKVFDEEKKNENIMEPIDEKLVFGEYKLIDPTDYQIQELRDWCNANPGYKFLEFDEKCKELEITYQLKRPTAFGGTR